MKRWGWLVGLLFAGCAAELSEAERSPCIANPSDARCTGAASWSEESCRAKPDNPGCPSAAVRAAATSAPEPAPAGDPAPAPSAAPEAPATMDVCATKPMATGCPARLEADALAVEAERDAQAQAQAQAQSSYAGPSVGGTVRYRRGHARGVSGSGAVHVRSYMRRNGTMVHGHTRGRGHRR